MSSLYFWVERFMCVLFKGVFYFSRSILAFRLFIGSFIHCRRSHSTERIKAFFLDKVVRTYNRTLGIEKKINNKKVLLISQTINETEGNRSTTYLATDGTIQINK